MRVILDLLGIQLASICSSTNWNHHAWQLSLELC
jgi:hypothetical protein